MSIFDRTICPKFPEYMLYVDVYKGNERIETRGFEPRQYAEYNDYLVESVKKGFRTTVRSMSNRELTKEFLDYIEFTNESMVS